MTSVAGRSDACVSGLSVDRMHVVVHGSAFAEYGERLLRNLQQRPRRVQLAQPQAFAGNPQRFEQPDGRYDVGRQLEAVDFVLQLVDVVQKRVVGRSEQVAAVEFEDPFAVAVRVLPFEVDLFELLCQEDPPFQVIGYIHMFGCFDGLAVAGSDLRSAVPRFECRSGLFAVAVASSG